MKLLRKDFYSIIKPKTKEQIVKQSEIEEDTAPPNIIEDVKVIGAGVTKQSIIIADGVSYSIELITDKKYKRMNYHCPVTYGNTYNHITELRYMTNIVKYIFKMIGADETPC